MNLNRQDKVSGPSEAVGTSGAHRRNMVLRVLTDLFVTDGERQTAAEREINAELMVNLASEAGLVIRQEVAERLAYHPDPPRQLVGLLAADDIVVARPLLRHSPALSDEDLAQIILTTTIEHGRAVASRPALGVAVSDAIIAIEDAEAALTMLRNPHTALSGEGIRRLGRVARSDAAMVEALLARDNLEPAVLADLFWHTTSGNREAIFARLNADADWPSEQLPINAALRRANAESRKIVQEGLSKIMLARRIDDFRDLFGRAMGITPALSERIIKDEGGEPFAVACRAAGFTHEAYSTLLILYNPVVGRSVQRVFALGSIYEKIPGALAWRLLEAWNAVTRERERPASVPWQGSVALRSAIHESYAVRTDRSDTTYSASRGAKRALPPLRRPAKRSAGGSGA